MKIATILPTKHIWLEEHSDYHLCLAHQIVKDLTYAFFFRAQVRDKKFVILDNGAAEHGVPMPIGALINAKEMIRCQEMVLPDTIMNTQDTLDASYKAMRQIKGDSRAMLKNVRLMAVPHGRDEKEWIYCAKEMMSWEIDTVGISKFLVPSVFPSRARAVKVICEMDWGVDIHLLGYTGVDGEIQEIERQCPGMVRGIDSSIATLWTQLGMEMQPGRPKVDLNLEASLDKDLLKRNIEIWRELCSI